MQHVSDQADCFTQPKLIRLHFPTDTRTLLAAGPNIPAGFWPVCKQHRLCQQQCSCQPDIMGMVSLFPFKSASRLIADAGATCAYTHEICQIITLDTPFNISAAPKTHYSTVLADVPTRIAWKREKGGYAADGESPLCCYRYDWFGDHNLPWQTDLNTLNNTIDWNKLNAISATPNPFDNRNPDQTGGGFGLLPWYLRSAVITPRAAPGPARGPAAGPAAGAAPGPAPGGPVAGG